MRVELMVSVLQTEALPFRHPWKNCARRDFYPRTLPASTGIVSAAVDDLQGAFAAPFAYPCSVSGASATTVRAPEPLSARPAVFIRIIQPRPVDAKQEDFRVPRLNYLHKLKATEGFAPPYPIVPWTSPSTDSNRLSGLRKPDSPSGGLHFSSAMLLNGLEPNKGLEPLT